MRGRKLGIAYVKVPQAVFGELSNKARPLNFTGRPCRDRTDDPLIKSQLLYQLS